MLQCHESRWTHQIVCCLLDGKNRSLGYILCFSNQSSCCMCIADDVKTIQWWHSGEPFKSKLVAVPWCVYFALPKLLRSLVFVNRYELAPIQNHDYYENFVIHSKFINFTFCSFTAQELDSSSVEF